MKTHRQQIEQKLAAAGVIMPGVVAGWIVGGLSSPGGRFVPHARLTRQRVGGSLRSRMTYSCRVTCSVPGASGEFDREVECTYRWAFKAGRLGGTYKGTVRPVQSRAGVTRGDLINDVPSVPHLADWRRFIAASGVFPRSVSGLPLRTWQSVERLDWTSWQSGIASALPRNPVFGDYVTRAPGAPAGGGNPPVNLRYTSDDFWAVRVDGRHQDGDAVEMHKICESLLEQPFFRGEEFSAGDMEMVRTADPEEGPGGPMQWLQWGVSHHIEQVVDQLTGVVA